MGEEIKHYSRREERLNFLSHFLGFLLVCAGFFPLRDLALTQGDWSLYAATVFYTLALMATFFISMSYHWEKDEARKKILRKLDHCAIYWAITGTYAPLMFGAVRSAGGYWIFGGLVFLSVNGTVGKFLLGHRFHCIEIGIYLLMGWCCVGVAGTMIRTMSCRSLIFLLAGGLAYSGGIAAYASRREFAHTLWHCFVLSGAAFHYFAILAMLDK